MQLEQIRNKIIHADSIDILKQLPDKCIDLVLTDPPYELNLRGGVGMGAFCGRKLIKTKHIDFIAHGFDYATYFNEFIRICKKVNLYIFCSNKQITKIMNWFESKGYIVNLLVWHKTNAVPLVNKKYLSNAEYIICVRENGTTFNNLSVAESTKVFSFPYPFSKNRFHPTQKPLELIKILIRRKSNKNDLILDPFLGSGTTAVAAYELGRNFIGVEKEEKFCKAANERLENIRGQQKLF